MKDYVMKIILAIHPLQFEEQRKKTVFLLEKMFGKDANTFYIRLGIGGGGGDAREIKLLKNRFPGKEKNFILLHPKGLVSDYGKSYKKGFAKAMRALRQRLGKGEKAEFVSFGGNTRHCYRKIQPQAHEEAKRIFGERLVKERSFLPLMWEPKYCGDFTKKKQSCLRPNRKTSRGKSRIAHRKIAVRR